MGAVARNLVFYVALPLSSTLNSKKKRIYDIEEQRYFFLEQENFIRVSIVIHSTYFGITVNNYWTKLYEFRMSPERIANLRIKGAPVTELVNLLPPYTEATYQKKDEQIEDK
ncbi:Protein CBG26755 [Caenorhabditis briggsae]|uniref:Protein CBG26755 n=1 Tax=Caenorhabditis briggsae TaxID=6238 RepID=B6IED0_CAEBR|nr:Protein CBG26755 [Caenorhabditis briggsae]CAS01194.1 Protein CBG26755 [Caenorhabditis briggsae]